VRAQDNFLMHRIDAVVDRLMRRRESHWSAFPIYFACRAGIHPGKQLDKRRFTGTVFTDNCMDFARLEI
jgi:hypothetical protein